MSLTSSFPQKTNEEIITKLKEYQIRTGLMPTPLPTMSTGEVSICYGNGVYLVHIANDTGVCYSKDLINWKFIYLPKTPGSDSYISSWKHVCYGNGRFVCIGHGQASAYSDDGLNWTYSLMATSVTYRDLTYIEEKHMFVATGNGATGNYSYDGVVWFAFTLGSYDNRGFSYGNGRFVTLGYNSYYAVWSDKCTSTWTAVAIPTGGTTAYNWIDCVYGGDKFVGIAYNTDQYCYSYDGKTWYLGTLPYSSYWTNIAYGNGMFQIVSTNGTTILRSFDGLTWEQLDMPQDVSGTDISLWESIRFMNDRFIMVNPKYQQIAVSVTGEDWNGNALSRYQLNEVEYLDIAYGNGVYVAPAYQNSGVLLYSTDDGENWEQAFMPDDQFYLNSTTPYSSYVLWRSVCYGDGKFIAVASLTNAFTRYAYSYDGIHWEWGPGLPRRSYWSCICFSKELHRWVALSNSNTNYAAYSDDGISWHYTQTPASRWYRQVEYIFGRFVALADGQYMSWSKDGINWVDVGTNNRTWRESAYGDGILITMTHADVYRYTYNGYEYAEGNMPNSRNWTPLVYIPAEDFGDELHPNGRFVTLSYGANYCAYTDTHVSAGWTEFTIPQSANWMSMAYGRTPNNTKRIVAVSYGQNYGLYSDDLGITWSSFTLPQAYNWVNIKYEDGQWILLEERNNASSYYGTSTDGITWTIEKHDFNSFRDACYVDGKWYMPSYNNLGMISTANLSLSTWKDLGIYYDRDFRIVRYGENVGFCALGYGTNASIVSSDGFAWRDYTNGNARNWLPMAYGNGVFAAITYGANYVKYSEDGGKTWTEKTLRDSLNYNCMIYNGKAFWCSAYNNPFKAWSPDGKRWTSESNTVRWGRGLPQTANWDGLGYYKDSTKERFILPCDTSGMGYMSAYSEDGINWMLNRMPNNRRYKSACIHPSDPNHCVMASWGTRYGAYSDDGGINWIENNMTNDWSFFVTVGGKGSDNVDRFISLNWNATTGMYSEDYGHSWVALATALPFAGQWRDGKYDGPANDKKFVVIASASDKCITSEDGLTWTAVSMPRNLTWRQLIYADGKWVACAENSHYLAYSTDNAVTWQEIDYNADNLNTDSIAYYNGIWLMLGNGIDFSLTSTNLTDWERNYTDSNLLKAYGEYTPPALVGTNNGFILANRGQNYLSRSYDGIEWSHYNKEQKIAKNADGSIFVSVWKMTDTAAWSTNGYDWNYTTLPKKAAWSGIACNDITGRFVAITANSKDYAVSDDNGKTWTLKQLPTQKRWKHITFGQNNFVISVNSMGIGDNPLYSSDNGETWTSSTVESFKADGWQWTKVVYANGLYVCFPFNTNGHKAFMAWSNDGETWNKKVLDGVPSWTVCTKAIYYDNKWFVFPNNGKVVYSSNNWSTWSTADLPYTGSWYDIGHSYDASVEKDVFVLIGYGTNRVLSSNDCLNWDGSYYMPSTVNWRDIAHGDSSSATTDIFVASAYGTNVVGYSTDGYTWGSVTKNNRNWCGLAYGNGKWVSPAYNTNVVSYSTNGMTWSESTSGLTSRKWNSITFTGTYFVMSTEDSKYIAKSTDGITWTESMVLPEEKSWAEISYVEDDDENERLYITSKSGTVHEYYSEDAGSTWVSMTLPRVDLRLSSIIYGPVTNKTDKGVISITPYNSQYGLYSHDDGVTWNYSIMPSSANWGVSAYVEGYIVCLGIDSNKCAYSYDGRNWQNKTMASSCHWRFLEVGPSKNLVAVAWNTQVTNYSLDGGMTWATAATSSTYDSNWTLPTTTYMPYDWYYLVYSNGMFITRNTSYTAWSPTGYQWKYTFYRYYTGQSTSNAFRWLAWSGSKVIGVLGRHRQTNYLNSVVAVSNDYGYTWENTIQPFYYEFNMIGGKGNDGDGFCILSQYGRKRMYSKDGLDWITGDLHKGCIYEIYKDGVLKIKEKILDSVESFNKRLNKFKEFNRS